MAGKEGKEATQHEPGSPWGCLRQRLTLRVNLVARLAAGENKNGQLAAAGNFISFGVLEILLCTPVYSSPQIDIDLL